MIERQVIVTWYAPVEKRPPEDVEVMATISGRGRRIGIDKSDINFKQTIIPMYYDKDEGWYSTIYDFDLLIVHAWCDLEPYGGCADE
jgi:hypothetical protein